MTLYLLFVENFSTALDNFVSLLMVWVGPYGGVWICDGFLRRGKYDPQAIHTRQAAGEYWGWRGMNSAGYLAMAAGMVAAALSMKSPLYDGPLATLLGGTDLSWILGFPVSMVTYRLVSAVAVTSSSRWLRRLRNRRWTDRPWAQWCLRQFAGPRAHRGSPRLVLAGPWVLRAGPWVLRAQRDAQRSARD